MLPRSRSVVVLVAVVALVTGLLLLLYARWTEPLVAAQAAVGTPDAERALGAYERAAERFRDRPLAQRLLGDEFALGAHNELALLYRLQRYDEVIEKAAVAPESAGAHFWAGCALFKKAAQEEKQEKQLEWVARAEEEFKKALSATPDDWDAKVNYELAARLTAELRPNPKAGTQQKNAPSTLMRLLRPQSDQKQQQRTVRKVG